MEYTGSNVELDIEQSWEAAQIHLPAFALAYAEAHQTVSGVEFNPHGDVKFRDTWNSLQERLLEVLSQSATNLYDTATALRTAFESYVETDGDSAAEIALTTAQEEHGEEPDPLPDME